MLKKIIICLLFINLGVEAKSLFNLMTTFYNEPSNARLLEFKRCFQENIKNKFIKKIYVFYEKPKGKLEEFLLHPKIEIVPIDSRPTYKLYFDYANMYLKNELIIICNTDIFFDKTLQHLLNFNFNNRVIVLTRYNIPEYKGNWKRHPKSHDSWIFKTPFKDIGAYINLGIPGCENEILKLFKKNKIEILNPSLTIKSWHVHLDDNRTYFQNAYKGTYTIIIPFTKL